MPGKGNPRLEARLPRNYLAALELEARKAGESVSEHLRGILKAHFQRVYDTQSSGVIHLENLTRLVKQYLITLELSRQGPQKQPMKEEKEAGEGLPGSAKRDSLEGLVWQAVQEAVAYSKTEDAAKNALAGLLALRVANSLMRTELALRRLMRGLSRRSLSFASYT
jgi:hypothetical protein